MRILLIAGRSGPGSGDSVTTSITSIAPALDARGHEVHILSCAPGQTRQDFVDDGVHVHLRPLVRLRWVERISRIMGMPKTARRVRSGFSAFAEYRRLGVKFDVVEYPDVWAVGWALALFHPTSLIAALHLPLALGVRYESLPRNVDIMCCSWLERLAARRADVVISPSGLLARALVEARWLGAQRVDIIPNAIDWQRWRHADPVLDSPPTVLFLGWLSRNKAPEVLARAIAIIRRELPEAQALFVGGSVRLKGGSSYLDWMRESVASLDGCRFVGRVQREDLVGIFSETRVLAAPSWFENYSLAVLEAMATGRPVVVTASSGLADLVEETGAGVVVPPGDPDALASALGAFLRDPSYAAAAGARARTAVQEWADPDRIAALREVVYREAGRTPRRLPWVGFGRVG